MEKVKQYFFVVPSFLFIVTAILKFTTPAAEIAKSTPSGMSEKVFYLGILQLLCIALFLVKRTMNLGFYLVCSYLGGAMAVNLTTGQDALPPAILLSLFWIAVYLKRSDLFILPKA